MDLKVNLSLMLKNGQIGTYSLERLSTHLRTYQENQKENESCKVTGTWDHFMYGTRICSNIHQQRRDDSAISFEELKFNFYKRVIDKLIFMKLIIKLYDLILIRNNEMIIKGPMNI